MVNKTVEVRNGLKFTFSVPADVDEYNKAANRGTTAVLDDAIDNNVYRTGLPDGWQMLGEALEKQYNVKRLTKPHTNAEKAAKGETVIAETWPAFVDRVAAQNGAEPTSFQPIVDSFEVIPLDLTERKGSGGAALVGKGDLDMALQFINSGPEKCARALGKIAKVLGTPVYALTGDLTVDQKQVGLQIKTYRTELAKREMAKLTA
jgi:hypothetical protein